MIDWLQKKGSYTSNGIHINYYFPKGLTLEEKEELYNLRSQIQKYRELDNQNTQENEDNISQHSEESVMTNILL
jgi:hypothetical protein